MTSTPILKVDKDRRKTVFTVHDWPHRDSFRGFVCSSQCGHDDVRLIADAWQKEDATVIGNRLRGNGIEKGRLLFYVARPPLSSKLSLQREAAGLLHLRRGRKGALELYRVCFRIGLVTGSKSDAFFATCTAAHRLASALGLPAQIYLEPGMDRARVEKRLPGFKSPPKKALTRTQSGCAGSWLQRDP